MLSAFLVPIKIGPGFWSRVPGVGPGFYSFPTLACWVPLKTIRFLDQTTKMADEMHNFDLQRLYDLFYSCLSDEGLITIDHYVDAYGEISK